MSRKNKQLASYLVHCVALKVTEMFNGLGIYCGYIMVYVCSCILFERGQTGCYKKSVTMNYSYVIGAAAVVS